MPPHRSSRLHALTWLVALLLSFLPFASSAAEPAPDTSTARYEIAFLEGMIDHHAMAVHMASLCGGRATHTELLAMCQQVATTQQQEIAIMQSWLLEWYGISYQPMMKPGMMKDMEHLAPLSGAEFEIAFMQMMIKHHAKAVQEGSKCIEQAYHSELVSMCEDIVIAQTLEIGQMREWLCDWYGICGSSRKKPV